MKITTENNIDLCCSKFFDLLREEQKPLDTHYSKFLEISVMEFLADECEERAHDVYTTFFDIYKLNNPDGKSFSDLLDKLREYENKVAIINNKHRDHYVHSVNVFALGLAIYGKNTLLRLKFKQKFTDLGEHRRFDIIHEEFLFRWGIAALFHDIGYPIEIMNNQLNEFVNLILGDGSKTKSVCPYIDFINFSLLNRINLKSETINEAKSKIPSYMKYEEDYDLTNPLKLMAMRIANDYQFESIPFESINDDIQNYLSKMQKNGFVDHGFYSAIIVLKWYGETIEANGTDICVLYSSILDAATAIILHNYYEKTLIKKFDAPKMAANCNPLAYLLAFCDAAQEWNRASYGKISKLNNCVDRYKVDIENFGITFSYDTNDGEINQKFINKKNALFDMLFYLDDIFPEGVKVTASTITQEFLLKIKSDEYIPSVRPIIDKIEILAREINNRYNERERKKGNIKNITLWDDLSDMLKYSNVRSARDIIFKLGIVNCTTEDNGTEPIESLTQQEIEVLARYEHDQWVAERTRTGWIYGERKDKEKKITPALIPYEMLSEEEKEKDRAPARDIIELLSLIDLKVYRK